jgi:hypothetical protein
VALAIIVVVGLPVALPAKIPGEPPWAVPVVLLALLAALIIADPGRIDRQKTWLRATAGTVIALLALANLIAADRLVGDLITSNKLFASNATRLLATGAVIWATSVIAFGLWYRDLDRAAAAHARRPQATRRSPSRRCSTPEYAPATWVPEFADCLSLWFGPPPRSGPPTSPRSSGGPSC